MTAIHSFGAAYIIYVVCNGSIYYYAAHLLGIYSRVLDSPIIEFRWIDLHLFLRMIVSGILVSTVFSVSNRLYEITYSYVSYKRYPMEINKYIYDCVCICRLYLTPIFTPINSSVLLKDYQKRRLIILK